MAQDAETVLAWRRERQERLQAAEARLAAARERRKLHEAPEDALVFAAIKQELTFPAEIAERLEEAGAMFPHGFADSLTRLAAEGLVELEPWRDEEGLPYKTFGHPSEFPPNHADMVLCGGSYFYIGAKRAPEGQKRPDRRMRACLRECGLL